MALGLGISWSYGSTVFEIFAVLLDDLGRGPVLRQTHERCMFDVGKLDCTIIF